MREGVADKLDAALAALARAEHAARPAVSDDLRARVLADAAEVAAGHSAAVVPAAVPAARPARPAPRANGWRGWRAWVGGIDLWAGAAVAAALICLAVGLGIGYGAGDQVMAGVGFENVRLAQAGDDAALIGEDVL